MNQKNPQLAVIVAGGTGGHLYPGIAAAKALLGKSAGDWRVVFMVRRGDLGKALLQREGFEVIELTAQGLPRRLSPKLLTFPVTLLKGFFEARAHLRQLRPSVIMGMGGYLSFPVLLAGSLQKIPTLIHEQNVFPGLANRLLARSVQSIAISFPESSRAFPDKKVWVSGLPVRPEIGTVSQEEGRQHWTLPPGKLTVLVFGGSQGARRINEVVLAAWRELGESRSRFQFMHITGPTDFERMEQAYREFKEKAVVLPYCHEMPAALAAADLVICRAGASTVVELLISQKPSILIPFPFASENHQFYNAEVLTKAGGAEILLESELTPAALTQRLRSYLEDPGKLPAMQSRLAQLQGGGHLTSGDRLADFLKRMSL